MKALLPMGDLPLLFTLGLMIILSYLAGKWFKWTGIPMIVAYMLTGVLLGPSGIKILDEALLSNMHFLTQGLLAFIAFKIGLDIEWEAVKAMGKGLFITTMWESLASAVVVAVGVFFVFGDIALGLAMGALAPASAPAGTLAVIEEYRAGGKLTETLYSVVALDDGVGILIFGLVTPFAVLNITEGSHGITGEAFGTMLLGSLEEIGLSILLGSLVGMLFVMVSKKNIQRSLMMILTFGFVLLLAGTAQLLGASLILSNMVLGLAVGNNNRVAFLKEVEEEDLGVILPFFFLIFFTIAGANLHIDSLPQAGVLALIYLSLRTLGKYGGAFVGSWMGGFERRIQKNLGMTILSQAGVAIGLSLVIKQELSGMGPEVAEGITRGDRLGNTIFTTITATSIFFELIGPILAKYGLKRAGEIPERKA